MTDDEYARHIVSLRTLVQTLGAKPPASARLTLFERMFEEFEALYDAAFFELSEFDRDQYVQRRMTI